MSTVEIKEYVSYLDLPQILGIKKGDRVYLASNIMPVAFAASKNGQEFDPNKLIDAFLEVIGEEGTLLIPTFHFQFSNKGSYNYNETPCFTGALGNAVLKRKDFKRTLHPMHSFCVWGKDTELLCSMTNLNSFGDDSPFGYMLENNVIQVMLAADYQQCMTFVHFVEKRADVPYRFFKKFTGEYTDSEGITTTRTYEYPARYLEMGSVEKFNRIGEILENKGISTKYIINDYPVVYTKLGDCYDTIYDDAKNNMAANLYDFSCDREEIWKENAK